MISATAASPVALGVTKDVASLDRQRGAPGADGKLAYKTTPKGDRILDFSHAGYGDWLSSHEKPVMPESLYLAQLRERLRESAVKNIEKK